MCGIVAYIGTDQAYSHLIRGLKRLEYRGYDSAGIALLNDRDVNVYKTAGKVADLEAHIGDDNKEGTIGIGHTRWATHGPPSTINAHPHQSRSGHLSLIHNGIIENYNALREELTKRGYEFYSNTDTEVLVNLIEEIKVNEKVDLPEAVRIALNEVVGAYAIVVLDCDEPERLVAARKSSPLVIGIGGSGDYFLASDATPIVEHTKDVVYMNDNEVAVVERGKDLVIKNNKDQRKTPYIQELEFHLEELEKGGYDHFMLKEINEQPRSVKDCMRGRINAEQGWVSLGGIKDYLQNFVEAERIILVACGTSWHAALVGEYLFEDLSRTPVEVEYASEFRYRNPIINKGDVVIAISQSGETADTLAAVEMAKEKGAIVIGICNVVGSSISRATHAGSYTHAGPEIGVASTKAFSAQVTILALMALSVGQERGKIEASEFNHLLKEIEAIPEKIEETLSFDEQVKRISAIYKDSTNALYLGRGYNFPVALEGALKLKEISYIHAEGYPAAEMKHGPLALIDEEMPVVFIATRGSSYEKILSNIEEVKARKGKVIAIVSEGDQEVGRIADHIIEVPRTKESLWPLLTTIPLQLLSYHVAVMRGCNVDQPRNLAKSVTVE